VDDIRRDLARAPDRYTAWFPLLLDRLVSAKAARDF
jgi:hypothetical protein